MTAMDYAVPSFALAARTVVCEPVLSAIRKLLHNMTGARRWYAISIHTAACVCVDGSETSHITACDVNGSGVDRAYERTMAPHQYWLYEL